MIALWILVICIAAIECNEKRLHTPIVQTNKGPVQGEILKTISNGQRYYSFRGIPYASPPVGSLRFKPPIEAEPWTDIKQTVEEGSPCFQFGDSDVIGSEDCLFLNVFTPAIDGKNLKAVIFSIHGGQFLMGGTFWHGPDFFIEEDIVFVSINYRLGPLVLAMQWVNKNIKNFGGDPDRVMIYGLSSGSMCVDLHIVSDLSKGLFHRSIADGGLILFSWGFSTPKEAKENAFELGALLNNNQSTSNVEDIISILQKADASEIVLKSNLLPQWRPFRPSLGNATISKNDTKFLTECYIDKFLSGNYSMYW
ncbi:esterase FE4-like [Contarinia nasturtii]|uniref:esterase FE4-like n=1 Tax=Contarinia nasturtii TaxID=265458 RepID=UPI0012D3C4AA|nr:esterase FE4-like [Contarinia nasturtii]